MPLSVEIEGVAIERDIPLRREGSLILGREGDLRLLGDQSVGRRHAELQFRDGGLFVEDLSSGHSRINDQAFLARQLILGDVLQIRSFFLEYRGSFLRWSDGGGSGIEARGLVRQVPDRHRIGEMRRILDNAELVAGVGQFVGLLGPSGAGKSTLLKAAIGLSPAQQGSILVDGEDITEDPSHLSSMVGYVPQDDIVHSELTVEQALMFSARLRLPQGIPESEIRNLIEHTCGKLGLEKLLKQRIKESSGGGLSGGQRKRVSVAVELLSSPRFLFLDEPTSGLDPATETELMGIFRLLANQGRTVVCTTHVVENAHLMDKLIVVDAGRTVFSGEWRDAPGHFGASNLIGMYVKLEEDTQRRSEEAKARRATEGKRVDPNLIGKIALNVANQVNRIKGAFSESLPMLVSAAQAQAKVMPKSVHELKAGSAMIFSNIRSAIPSLRVLLQRQLAILLSDWKNVALLVLQPLLIGLILGLFVPQEGVKLFFTHLSVLWLGCNNSAQEIVKEINIYRRERFVGLGIGAYLSSKFIFGSAITLLQAFILFDCVYFLGDGIDQRTSLPLQLLTLFVTALMANSIGLAISACAKTAELALFVVPMFLIPQVLFSGGVVTLNNWYEEAPKWQRDANHKVTDFEPGKVKGILHVVRWMPSYSSQRLMDCAQIHGLNLKPLWSANVNVIKEYPLAVQNLHYDYGEELGESPDGKLESTAPILGAAGRILFYAVLGLVVAWLSLRVRERE